MPMTRNTTGWLAVRRELTTRGKWTLGVASFLLPFAVWCLISYVPFIWHPQMRITNPGSVDYFQTGMQIDRDVFDDELAHARSDPRGRAEGVRANPDLPAPHQVLRAFYTAFTTPPASRDGVWLHEPVAQHPDHLLGLRDLVRDRRAARHRVRHLQRARAAAGAVPGVLPLPARTGVRRADGRDLGIYDAPKVAIIVIGTLFQQVLIIANTTRKLEYGLFEAAMTLGTKR